MRTLALLALAALLQEDARPLKYAGKKGDSVGVKNEWTLQLKVEGSEALVNMVRSGAEFLSLNKLHVRGEGVRRVARADKKGANVVTEIASARVEGSYDDEPYEFDFDRSAPPEGLDKDKLKQICWFLTMGGPNFTLGPRGEYASSDANQEAWGEALDFAMSAPVRLPEKDVKSGEEWTSEWTGTRKQKDNGGKFKFSQKAKVARFDEKDGRKRAVISFSAAGTLDIPEEKRDKNASKQETTFEAKGTLVLDLDRGLVVSIDSKGSVVAYYKGTDPNTGDEHELKIAATAESKSDERE